jgi:hypothetical protein
VSHVAYRDYWKRKQLLSEAPHFPVRRWWRADGLCEIERVYFDAVRTATRLLDVGAGDLRIQQKLVAAGFRGEYHTQDVGTEFAYTYRSLDEIAPGYDAVLCLDVIEHLRLEEGLSLLDRLIGLLTPGGVLVLQTPNARCIRNPLSWDLTHLHIYNVADLWAYVRALGLDAIGYRVWFAPERFTPAGWLTANAGRLVTTRLLGCDYADNIALVARKVALPEAPG